MPFWNDGKEVIRPDKGQSDSEKQKEISDRANYSLAIIGDWFARKTGKFLNIVKKEKNG